MSDKKEIIIFEAKPLFKHLFGYCRNLQMQQYAAGNNITSCSLIYLDNITRCLDMLLKMKEYFKRMTENYTPYLYDTNISTYSEHIHFKRNYSFSSAYKTAVTYLRLLNLTLTPETAEEYDSFYSYFYNKSPKQINFKLGYHNYFSTHNFQSGFFRTMQVYQSFISTNEQHFIWDYLIKDIPLCQSSKPVLTINENCLKNWENTGVWDKSLCSPKRRCSKPFKRDVNIYELFDIAEHDFGKDCLLEYGPGPIIFTDLKEDFYFDPIYENMVINKEDYYEIFKRIKEQK
jgi:hypothetical protein